MKCILTLLFAYSIMPGIAQTPLIAHKSHAGVSASFFIDPLSNFGARLEFPYHIETTESNIISVKPIEIFIPLNDSVILRRSSAITSGQNVINTDTLTNKNRYSIFEFQHKYKDSIRQSRLEKWSYQYASQLLDQPAVPAKKKKKSYLLFLFGITGGGMLLMRLFRGSKITNPSIA